MNVPKLRFPEFNDDWEEKKFYDIFAVLQNNTFSRDQLNYENGEVLNIHYGDVLIKFGDYIDCQNDKLPFINTDKNLTRFDQESYARDGDIIIADTAEDYSAGKVSEVFNVNNLKILSGLHTFLARPTFNFASKYLGYKMNSNSYHSQVATLVAGTKVYSINRKAIAETSISYPSLAEQKKIADFLSNVDSIIASETKILNALQKKKKALMQKLFSQQLRFKADDGSEFPEWEEKKLGEICEYIGGGTPSKKNKDYWNGNINWASVKDITGKYLYETQDKITQLGVDSSATNICEANTLILITRMSPGKTAITKCKTAINQDLKIIKSNIDVEFLHLLFQSIQSKIDEKTSGTTVKGISVESLNQLDINLPCEKEQQKIADCLSSLDSLIQNQQKVVTNWQQRKKALLQQMFI